MHFRPQLNFEKSPATLLLMVTVAALEVICTVKGELTRDYYLFRWLGLTPAIWEWQLWRPFSSTLLHGGLIHAVFNLYWLAIFGAVLESWWGTLRFMAFVVLAGVVASMLQFVLPDVGQSWSQTAIQGAVGFSGINYAMFGFLLVARHRHGELYAVCDTQTAGMLLAWAALGIPMQYFGLLPIANVAHFSGLAVGFFLAKVIYDARRRVLWGILLSVLCLAGVIPIFYAPWATWYQLIDQEPGIYLDALRTRMPQIFE